MKEPVYPIWVSTVFRNMLCMNLVIRVSWLKVYFLLWRWISCRLKVSWKPLWLLLEYSVQQFPYSYALIFWQKQSLELIVSRSSQSTFSPNQAIIGIVLGSHITFCSNQWSRKRIQGILCLYIVQKHAVCESSNPRPLAKDVLSASGSQLVVD